MHIKDTLINFLYDKEYFISIYDNFIHVFNYKDLISLTNKLVILKLDKFKFSKLVHPSNIKDIVTTFDVLKFDKSRVVKLLHP